eukprot:TRINITY_DN32747_c0_g1_i1.p1 TRINITY_DN32747_c0_g1~~TRINITY_DN32747_c0_g1_i1.p1  ORF type:complete len:367 (-),score=62.15 TRINITY_DN32747_c0_g1_i1:84-1184(-)
MGNEHSGERFFDCGGLQETTKERVGLNLSQCYNDVDDDGSEEEVNFEDLYTIDPGVLGTGKFSVVHLCWRKNAPDNKFALKEIATHLAEVASLKRVREEIYILQVLGGHPGIIQLVDLDDSSPDRIRLVMDLCEGGELYDRIQQMGHYSEREGRACTGNIMKAVAYTHSKGIMHRDLKPENILLVSRTNNTDIKLSDFGLARISRDFPSKFPRATSICGSDFYLAPELIKQQEYGREIDIWAVGVIVYCLLSGTLPFFNSVLHKLYRQIVERDLSFPDKQWRNISKGGVDFVLRLLHVAPGERPTAETALMHPWIAEVSNASFPRIQGSDSGSFHGYGPAASPGSRASADSAAPLTRATPSHYRQS